ncbi:MFS transporter [Acinetobacter sp. B51(2017)]|uniref:MFS transporter n=1 Tax=Acinetobacter sp. B51(2017) TaxID=2060938 RepID=UPI000F07B642|nr:MFS transporter [Acinetobacter sp. B51(2017)]
MRIQNRLAGFYFFYYAIVGTFMPYWNLYLEDQGFNYAEIGFLASLAIITRFFAPFIWGWIADKSGKRMFLVRVATWVEACIWLLIFIIPNHFQSIALLMLIFSFFQNAILAQFEGVTAFWLGEKRAVLYGKVRQWGSIGFIVAVFAIGAILDLIHIRHLPIVLLCMGTLAFLWSLSIKEPDNAPQAQQNMQSILPVIKQPVVRAFFLIELILLFSHAPFYSFYSNYLKSHGFSTSIIGGLWSIGVIAEIIMFACAQFFFRRWGWRILVSMCLILTALRWGIVGLFTHSLWIHAAAQTIHAFSFGLFHLIAMRVIFEYFSPQQQGRAQALYSTVWGIGVALGSILAGYYWQRLGGEIIFILAALVTLLGLFLVGSLPKRISS